MNDALHGLGSAWSVILRVSLESSLLLGFVILVSLFYGNRLSPVIRGLLWALVAIRLVLPFTPSSHWSVFNLFPGDQDIVLAAALPAAVEVDPFAEVALPDAPVAAATQLAWWMWLPGAIWLAGFLVILIRAIVLQVRTARWVDSRPTLNDPGLRALLRTCANSVGVSRIFDMVQGPAGSSVAVFGFLRPNCLIVPANFRQQYTESQIRGIFLHELEHVRQRDLLWNWIMLLIQAVHWFNPLVWIAARSFRAERELRCDRFAVNHLSREDRVHYGRALLRTIEVQVLPATAPAFLPFVSRKKELKHRMTMILKPYTYQPLTQIAAGVIALAVGFTTFTSALADEEKGGAKAEEAAEGGAKAGPRDGEGAAKAGPRDGEGAAKAGPREGDGAAKAGARDGEGVAKMGPRDGEGGAKAGPRDGDGAAKAGGDKDKAPANNAALMNTKGGKMFKAYDKDANGGVTAEEIAAMREGETSRSEVRRLEGVIKDLNTDDKDKELNVEEFIRYLDFQANGRRRG